MRFRDLAAAVVAWVLWVPWVMCGCTAGSRAAPTAVPTEPAVGGGPELAVASVLPPLRCAAEIEPTRRLAEGLAEEAAAGVSPPSPPSPASPRESGPVRERLRILQRRVRELNDRAARVAAPVPLEVELRSALPDTYRVEALVIRLDGTPILAATAGERGVPAEKEPRVAHARLAPGRHRVRVQLVLRANFSGGIYDSVGYCFGAADDFSFTVAAPGVRGVPAAPVTVVATVDERSPTATFSSRPGIRFGGSATPTPIDLTLE